MPSRARWRETPGEGEQAAHRPAEQAIERTKQARDNADELREFVITLPEQFKNLPDATKSRVAELQKQANDLIVQATATYGELAGRGKRAVDEART